MKILVTGTAGFVGSHLADENFDSGIVKTIEWYLNKYNKENRC